MADRGVFLDKDGTLIVDVPYNVDPARIQFQPYAVEALRYLHRLGYRLIVVSNQSGVARGYFAEESLRAVERCLREMLWSAGVPLSGFYYCPHHPLGTVPGYAIECSCRKPKPGLILRACAELGLNPKQSWLIGDILHDVEAGRRAGCRTILIDNGNETEWFTTPMRLPHHIVADFREAQHMIAAVDIPTVPTTHDECLAVGNHPGGAHG